MTSSTPQQDFPAPTGEWRRPHAGDQRSPCPALNSLANGGNLPRNGRVTVDQLVDALSTRLALPRSMGRPLAKLAMARLGARGSDGETTLDLAALFLHGFLEHDASLTRRDARDGDAREVVPALVDQLLSMSADGRTLALDDLAAAHQLRMIQSAAGRGRVPRRAGVLGTIEAALLFQLLRRGEGIPNADAREFLEHERIPAGVPLRELGFGSLLVTIVQLAVLGNVRAFAVTRRARNAAAERLAAQGCPPAPAPEEAKRPRGDLDHGGRPATAAEDHHP